ncbi:glycerophosphodiester phosphodiesterase [Spirochaetota bacterium]
MKKTKKFFQPEPHIFAHRGIPSEYPENSLISFQKARESGAHVIETDVHLTRDNRFVIFHDDTLERTTGAEGKIANFTLSELRQFDIAYNFSLDGISFPYRGKNLKVLSLEELLEEFPEQRFNIELKNYNPSQVHIYCDIIKKMNCQNRVLTASECSGNLTLSRALIPQMATSSTRREAICFLLSSWTGFIHLRKKYAFDALQIPEYYRGIKVLNARFIDNAHNADLRVHVWTVNNEKDMVRLIKLGVDGIMSDCPVLLKKISRESKFKNNFT